MSPRLLLILTLSGLAITGCAKKDDFDQRVHAYLMAHPEVIQEAAQKLQEKQDAAAQADAQKAIPRYRQALERDPRDFVANPNGKITVTEFYDYRCPHCVNIAPGVLSLIQADPDVRVVFKEFPIFGPTSEKAAAGAVAVKQAGGDYLGLYHDLMGARPLDAAAIDRILAAHGVDAARLAQLQPATARQLADVRQLAIALNIEGTPAFVVGDTIIPGEDLDGLKAAIAKARSGQG